ncbi:hypothetical protein BGW42_005562 [Actinomortierella wolfii]|nr:hypothetical protein BGW42_005562 [Actinomortierella wolfii]
MDDMHALRADLARIREEGDSLGSTSFAQSTRENALVGQDDNGESGLSLGRALVVLFQSRPSTLKKVIKDRSADGVLSRMLQILTRHVESSMEYNESDDLTTQIERMREVYRPIMDKLIKKGNENEKGVAYILLDWLFKENKHKDIMLQAIAMDLESLVDKKQKLALLMALNFTIVEQGVSLLKPGKERDEHAENVKRAMQIEKPNEAARTGAGHPLVMVQEEPKPEPYQWFISSFKSIPRITREMQMWTPKANSLKHAALKDIVEMATKFNNSKMNFQNSATERDDIYRSASSLSLQNNVKSIQSLVNAHDQDVGARATCICMMLGYVDPAVSFNDMLTGKLFPVSDTDLPTKVLELTHAVIAGRQPSGRQSAYAIQRQLTLNMDEDQIRAQLPKMFSLLDHEDEVSKAVAEMVANYAISFPAVVLPEFLSRLRVNHQEVVRIRNIVEIVTEMADQGFLTAPLDAEADRMRDNLIDILLSKLNDTDLKIRMTSSHIASSIDPAKLVHALVPNLLSKDEKTRSSAELALVECLLTQRKDRPASEGLIALVDAIRMKLPEPTTSQTSASKTTSIKSPGQLLSKQKRPTPAPAPTPSMTKGPDENTLRLERVARVIHKWAEAVPSTMWPLYIERLVVKTYGSPSDQNLIRVWKEIGPLVATSTEGMTCLLQCVLSILEQQGSLTTEDLEQAVEASDEAIDDLRYSRLSPLLILKTIPPDGTDNPIEFNHVKQMAFALMPSMFPDSSLEQIYTQVTGLLGASNIVYDDIKSWVISLYNWITTWSIPNASPGQLKADLRWLCKILRDALLPILAIPMPTDDSSQALYKLQLGVMDALSQLIFVTAPHHQIGTKIGTQSSIAEPSCKIQEIVDGDEMAEDTANLSLDNPDGITKPSAFFALLLTAMLERISRPVETRDFGQIGVAVCMTNSLILTMQRLFQRPPSSSPSSPSSPNSASNDSEVNTLPRSWIPGILLDLVTPTLVMAIHETLGAEKGSSLRSNVEDTPGFDMLLKGCFQVMYTGVNAVAMMATNPGSLASEDHQRREESRTTSRATDQSMMDAVVAGFESEQVSVAVAALKLLGTLSATGTVQEAGLLTPLNLAKIRRGLGWLGSAEVNAQEKFPEIAPLLDKMWEMVA